MFLDSQDDALRTIKWYMVQWYILFGSANFILCILLILCEGL